MESAKEEKDMWINEEDRGDKVAGIERVGKSEI